MEIIEEQKGLEVKVKQLKKIKAKEKLKLKMTRSKQLKLETEVDNVRKKKNGMESYENCEGVEARKDEREHEVEDKVEISEEIEAQEATYKRETEKGKEVDSKEGEVEEFTFFIVKLQHKVAKLERAILRIKKKIRN